MYLAAGENDGNGDETEEHDDGYHTVGLQLVGKWFTGHPVRYLCEGICHSAAYLRTSSFHRGVL